MLAKYIHVKRKWKCHSVVSNFLWPLGTVACQAHLSMGFSRQEYWSESLFLSPGDLTDPGIKPRSLTLQANSLQSEPPRKPYVYIYPLFFGFPSNCWITFRIIVVCCLWGFFKRIQLTPEQCRRVGEGGLFFSQQQTVQYCGICY